MSNSNYAGFWLRFVAYIIDYVIVQILQSTIFIPLLGLLGFTIVATNSFDLSALEDMADENAIATMLAMIGAVATLAAIGFVIQILYFSFMESSKHQATLGKMALGLIVTGVDGEKLDLGRCLLRNICKIISSVILLIGYIMAGFTDKKQALHDLIAGALVVKK